MKNCILLSLIMTSCFQSSIAQLPDYVPPSNLLAWFGFDNSYSDLSGNNNNGIPQNGVTFGIDRFGNSQSALSLDGINDYVTGSIDSLYNTSRFSVSAWVKYVGNASSPPYDLYFQLGVYGNHTMAIGYNYPNQNLDFYGGNCFSNPYTSINLNDAWHHLVLVDSFNVSKVYLDGELLVQWNSGGFNNCYQNSPVFYLGGGANNQYVTGQLDDVGIWDRALNFCEINSLFNAGVGQDTTMLSTCGYVILPDSQLVDTSGSFMVSYQDSEGCDSLVQYDVTVYPEFQDSISIVTCDFAISPIGGDTIMSSGIYVDSGISINGCDSIIVINATIHASQSATDTEYACGEFTWIDGNTYTSNNNSAQVNLSTVNGCDSVVTLDLTILNADTSVTSSPPSLEANADSATYQWIDCTTSLPIDSATSQVFIAQNNGSYAVAVTQNGCIDTSSCYQINNVGMERLNVIEASVFPNPSSNNITIQCSGEFDFKVLSIDGKTVLSGSGLDAGNCELADFPRGQYTIVVSQAGKANQYKVILN